MRKGVRFAVLVGVLTAGLVFASPAGAKLFIIAGAHVDTPEADDAQGLILEGEPRGDGCHFDVNDSGLGAHGFVVKETCVGPHCPYPFHYHGTLFGDPDPDAATCGWGEAIAFSKATHAEQEDAIAITLETEALFVGAHKGLKLTEGAIDSLENLKDRLHGDLKDMARDALDLDEEAAEQFEKALRADNSEARHRHVRKARAALEDALDIKQDIFKQLID